MSNFPAEQLNRTSKPTTGKYWGLWLPVPTILAIINSLFWSWLIYQTVGFSKPPKTDKREDEIIERF